MALNQDFIDDVQRRSDDYDYILDLKEGSFVDAEDTVKNWCVAQVKSIDEDNSEINVHYDGWSVKYDDDLPYTSNKMEPLRLITSGYTGMSRTAKRETWSYHAGDLETLKRKVEDTIQEEFANLATAFDVTQFLRGEMFIYVDWLLANCDTNDVSKDDFRDIVDFMHQVFKLIIKWLELFPSEYMKYYEVHRKVKKGFLVDRDIAISAAGIELIKIIDHCFNVHERITKATKSINLTEEEEQTSWYFTKKKDKKFKVALSHAFGSQGGFDAIIKFCTSVPLDTIDEKAVPLAYVNALLDSISEIISEFKDHEKKESLVVEIKKIITSQVDNITDDDVEKLEISQLNNLLEKLKHFGSLSENNDKEMEEMMELKLCHKLLRCPIFERRRQGMVNLIKIIEDLEEDENKSQKYSYLRKAKKQYEWLTLEHFLNWIKEEKLIDYVFGEYSHPEIIRKSGELLQKMCQQSLFSRKEIDLIWSVFDSNLHEDINIATLGVVEMIVQDWDEEILQEIRKRVHKFKRVDYDQNMVTFMKNFIIAEMVNFYRNDNMKKTGGIKTSIKRMFNMGASTGDADSVMTKEHVDWINKDLEILWKLPSQKGIPDNVKSQAFKAIPELLSHKLCSDKTKENYIDMAKKGLKNGEQIYNNLSFIKALLVNSSREYNETRKIIKDYNIADLVLMAADSYLTKAAKLFKEPYDFNNIKYVEKHLSERDLAFLSNKTHREHIEKMFDIIQYIIQKTNNSQPFTEKEMEKMFSVFITKRISNFESETLFDLITSEQKTGAGYSNDPYILGDRKLRKFIFNTCLVKKNYVSPHDYSHKSIRCFKDLFITVNDRENNLITDKESVIIKNVKNINCEGMETLWELAWQASNPIVQERAGYFLAVINYVYMDKKQESQWEKETDKTVEYLMDIIRQTVHGQHETLNHIKVLKQFIHAFETLDFPEHFRTFYKKCYEVEDDGEEEIMEHGYYDFLGRRWNQQTQATFAIIHKFTEEVKYVTLYLKDPVYKLK